MIRLTRKVFNDLSIWMIGFGLAMGFVFPFFVSSVGIPGSYVYKPWFFAATIAAGFIVGAINISLARAVVGSRLKLLAERMDHVTKQFSDLKSGKDIGECNAEECMVVVDSADEIGQSAIAFNSLVNTLFQSIETEESIKDFSRILGGQLSVEDLSDKALHQLIVGTGSAAGAIVIEKEGDLFVESSQGIRDVELILKSDHIKSVHRNEHRLILHLPEGVQVEGVLTSFRPHQVVIEPIMFKDITLGLIILASTKDYDKRSLDLLGLFTQNFALALHNSLLFDRLERLAALDELTGVYNRRFGLTRLHEEFGRTLRNEAPLGLMMIDIDHFKKVNDVYGHLTGDRVLIRLSKVVRSVIREGDILVRYGGEEFLVILPGASRKDVLDIADRICRKVGETVVSSGEDVIKTTVSLGGISYPENDVVNEVDLIDKADQSLYLAKESGRNCVVMYGRE